MRRVRRVVTGALEIERAQKRIGAASKLPRWSTSPTRPFRALDGVDFAEVCITSGIEVDARRGACGRLPP